MSGPGRNTVAIVNNEEPLVELLKYNLEQEGYEIRTYHDTAHALELLKKPANVAFLDRTNYPFNGVELYRRLRSGTDMPIIFLSAWAHTLPAELQSQGLKEADAYIAVPFKMRDLIETLRKVLATTDPS